MHILCTVSRGLISLPLEAYPIPDDSKPVGVRRILVARLMVISVMTLSFLGCRSEEKSTETGTLIVPLTFERTV